MPTFSHTDSSGDVAPVWFSHTTHEEPVDYRELEGTGDVGAADPLGDPFQAPVSGAQPSPPAPDYTAPTPAARSNNRPANRGRSRKGRR